MKLTLLLTLLAVSSSFSWHLSDKRDFQQVLQDEKSETPSIEFTADWKEIVHGELGVGKDFEIKYDSSRLEAPVLVQYKFNDGPDYLSEALHADTRISIPIDAEKVVMWFKHKNDPDKYDSDHGKNYHFAITAPSIVFKNDWSEVVHGDLVTGESFDLFYDSRRLEEGAQIVAQMKFQDDDVVDEKLQINKDSVYQNAVISIPKNAEKIEMWFYYLKKMYDSDYSKNYHFDLHE